MRHFLTGDARQNGFNPDDPSNYGIGPNDVPWVDVPDISNVPGAFDAANDPYAAYADGVITSLQENVSGGKVIGRANFVAEVRAWRSNQKALEAAILARMSISQAETSAFLNAQNKVTGYLQQFMDASGWFKDSPIPQDVRADVDGPLKNLYGVLAEDLKEALLIWDAKNNPPEASLFFDTLRAFSAGMQAGEEIAQQYRDTMKTIVHGASRIGIGFVPFVGPALDLCEAVSGHEFCLPSGRMLSTDERILSGVGFGIGKLVKVWGGVKTAAISTEGKLAAAGIVALDDIAEMMAAARNANYKGLKGWATNSISQINKFEKIAARHLVKQEGHQMLGFGDEGVRKVLGISLNDAVFHFRKSPDFLSITKTGGLALSEVKGVTTGQADVSLALLQLENGMRKLGEKNLAGSVERVQIIVPKGARLQDGYKHVAGKLMDKTNEVVLVEGRPDLIVQVVEL